MTILAGLEPPRSSLPARVHGLSPSSIQ